MISETSREVHIVRVKWYQDDDIIGIQIHHENKKNGQRSSVSTPSLSCLFFNYVFHPESKEIIIDAIINSPAELWDHMVSNGSNPFDTESLEHHNLYDSYESWIKEMDMLRAFHDEDR